jgi:hypothetical protein
MDESQWDMPKNDGLKILLGTTIETAGHKQVF